MFGKTGFVYIYNVIIKGTCGLFFIGPLYGDKVKKLVSGGAAEFTVVLKDNELSHRHISSCGGMVVFEHIYDSIPQKLKVFVGETGGFARKICGNISVNTVKRIGNNEFFAHGVSAFLLKSLSVVWAVLVMVISC